MEWSLLRARNYRPTAGGITLALRPSNADTLDSRAFVYLKMGKAEDAIAEYNIALGINPRLAASLYGRGVAKLKITAPICDDEINATT